MTIQNTYRKAVNKLPINNKKKNFMIRYWKGALLGFFVYPFLMWFALTLQLETLFEILGFPLKVPTIWITGLLCPSGDWGCLGVAISVMIILAAIAGLFIGMIVEWLIKRRR